MKVLTVSGSARKDSSNTRLLKNLHKLNYEIDFLHTSFHFQLPLFSAELEGNSPQVVHDWKKELRNADGVIFCTPEYIHNIPAALKSALEWVTASGELSGKKVLAITYTPHEPRGKKAMQSLLWSLQALDANILVSLELYKTDIIIKDDGEISGSSSEILKASLELFF